MKYTITILILLILFVNTALAQTYTGTVPNDLSVTTPTEGSTKFREVNNSIREIKTVDKNLYTILAVGTTTTLTGTSTFIIGSSTTALTLNFPTASTIATSTCTKEYVILNRNTGTVTLNIAVEGISGSPTVSQNNSILLYTDGTTWFEKRVQNAYNAVNFGNIGTSSFARSGANSDITAITGLTTYLAIGQGGSGTNTAAGAASAFGVGTEDTTTLTGVVTTGSSTITTLALSNGTVSGNLGISGSVSGLEDADIPNDATLTNITQITNRSLSNMQDTIGFATQTSGLLSFATQTSGLVSMATQTTGLISLATQTANLLSFATQTVGLVGLGTQTNGLLSFATQTTGLVSIATQTTGLVSLATQTTGNYLKSWTTGSQTTAATGTAHFNSTGDVTVTSTYNSDTGQGTITTALAAGVSAKPDAKVDGVVQVSNPTAYDFPGAFVSIAAAGSDADITFKNPSLATQTSGLLSIATQTTNLLSLATQTTQFLSIATQTTGLLSIATQTTNALAWDKLSGTPTDNTFFKDNIPTSGKILVGIADTILIPATTTTTLSGTSTTAGRFFNSQTTSGEITGSTTAFDDSSSTNHTITPVGNAVMSTTQKKFGLSAGLFDGSLPYDYLSIPAHANWNFGQNNFTIEIQRKSTDTASMAPIGWGTGNNFFYDDAGRANLFLISTGTDSATIASNSRIGTITTTTWTHVAISRQGNTLRGFTDGVQGGTWSVTGKTFDYSGNILTIGIDNSIVNYPYNGYIDEVRISNSARYTENFTEPTSAFLNDANTLLLINFDATGTAYFTNRLAYVPPGTTNAFLNIISDGTKTTKVEIVIGAETPFSTTTTHVLQGITASRTLFGFYDSYCFAESKDIIGSGTSVQDEAYAIAKRVSIVKSHPVIPGLKVKVEEAKTAAQEDYLGLFKKSDIETYKRDRVAEYTTTEAGSVSVNWANLSLDAQAYHETQRKAEFEVLPDLNERINKKKRSMESDKGITNISIIADNESTDDLLKGTDKRTANLNNGIGVLFGAFQRQAEEIGSLTAMLENQKIAYNEEVDNLYNWVNALAVALLAIGGISGWTTLRNKRKGT